MIWSVVDMNCKTVSNCRIFRQPFPKLGTSVVVLRRASRHLYFAKCLDYCVLDCYSELRLRLWTRGIFACWHSVKLFDFQSSHRSIHHTDNQGWWRELDGSCLLCTSTRSAIVYYLGYIRELHSRQDLIWCIATLQVAV